MTENQADNVFRGYQIRRETWRVGGRELDLTWPSDIDSILDAPSTLERFARNEYMPYWAQPWPAGVLLAEYILGQGEGRGRAAVELGCGVGLVSVSAAVAGWRVTASDHDQDALAFAELNASRNGVSLESTARIDFVEEEAARQYHCILASDLLYERRLSVPLARWIAGGLDPEGCALVSDPRRAAADGFDEALRTHGLQAEVIPASTTAPAGLVTRGRIWRITRS
jgi:predicted nicotinamide N-methyase